MTRPRLSYANVMSTLGVFIALGGTSYAVTKLPKGAVGSTELRSNAVTTVKLADGAVTSTKLAKGVAVTGPRGPRGVEGPAGPGAAVSTIVLSRPGADLAPTPNTPLTLASTVLPAGSWNLDGQVKLGYRPTSTGSEWVDCDLVSGTGDVLIRATAKLGNAGDAAVTSTVPLVTAVKIGSSTQIAIVCDHDHATAGQLTAQSVVLRATRVNAVEVR